MFREQHGIAGVLSVLAAMARELNWGRDLTAGEHEARPLSPHGLSRFGDADNVFRNGRQKDFNVSIPNDGSMETIELFEAPAKVNFGLWVGPRQSDGFHPVLSVMQTVTLTDTVVVRVAESPQAARWQSTDPCLTWTPDNLVYQTYQWLATFGQLPALDIRLTKRIPMGAGLGGGSADAAALLRWAELRDPGGRWKTQIGALGQDVPFMWHGGTAQATGYGAVLQPLPPLRSGAAVLANPGFSVSTSAVYEAFDGLSLADSPRSRMQETVAAVASGDLPDGMVNALEPAVFRVAPALRDFRDWLQSAFRPAQWYLSGSGATYYSVGPDIEWANWLARRMTDRGVSWARAVGWQGRY